MRRTTRSSARASSSQNLRAGGIPDKTTNTVEQPATLALEPPTKRKRTSSSVSQEGTPAATVIENDTLLAGTLPKVSSTSAGQPLSKRQRTGADDGESSPKEPPGADSPAFVQFPSLV